MNFPKEVKLGCVEIKQYTYWDKLVFKLFFTVIVYWLWIAYASAGTMLHDMTGQKISFFDLQGKWVLINYWASWCQPCIDEIPELNNFYEKNKENNVALFAVNYDALPLRMQQQLIKQFDIHYPSLKRDPANALQLGDIRGVPVTFVFNPQGQLSNTLYGGQTVESLKEVLATN